MTPAHTGPHTRSIGLDAARVLASGLVLLAHGAAVFLPMFKIDPPVTVLMGAYYGLELFFVLSGFLIGGLLFRVAESDATPHGWLIFMVRRWMRTLPIYWLWLAAVVWLLPAPEPLAPRLLAYATMTQNLAWPMPVDGWFNQSWTLAVEEWFYLLFSAALLGAVAKVRSQRAVWPVILAFLLLPALARMALPPSLNFETQVYHVVLLRLDAIGYGVALARLRWQGSALFRHHWLAFGAGCVLVGAGLYQHVYGPLIRMNAAQFNLGQLFLTSIGLCLFLAGLSGLRLRWHPLAWLIAIGSRMSYGVYLMHLTIIQYVVWQGLGRGYSPGVLLCVSLVATLALAWLGYRLVEAPLMALRPPQARTTP